MLKVLLHETKYQLRWGLPIWILWLLTFWWPDNRLTVKLRGLLHFPFIKKCGRGLQIAGNVILRDTNNIEIGESVYLSNHVWISGLGGVHIEDEVIIGPFVVITATEHVYQKGSFRNTGAKTAPVTIGKGSWLAAHVTITAGVTIGKGCLIAANSVVVNDIPSGMLAGGVPAKVIRECQEEMPNIMSRSGLRANV